MEKDLIIFKVQISILTNEDVPQMLAYNEDRSHQFQGDATLEIMRLVGSSMKKYLYGYIEDANEKGQGYIRLTGKVAPAQDW